MNIAYLQLGSNLGDRESILDKSIQELENKVGFICDRSSIYITAPWGVHGQPEYLNQILKLQTNLSANCLLENIMNIEYILGRKRVKKWANRVIDIDIILFNDTIIKQKDLFIPHKYMHERKFVLVPLNEIASNYMHPIYNKTIHDLLIECNDTHNVKKYEV
tara:strand:+ start:2025 stop:2510 length:486 start_codon:yes stop_codon:yes gene_type:complete